MVVTSFLSPASVSILLPLTDHSVEDYYEIPKAVLSSGDTVLEWILYFHHDVMLLK